MKMLFLTCVAALFCCAGCWFMREPENDPIETYDLAVPQVRPVACAFTRVRNLAPGGMKMLFREADGRIVEDVSKCWVQTPETMLLRYLQSSFVPAAKPLVELTLLRFELDRGRALAVLTCDCTVVRDGKLASAAKRYEFTAPLSTGASNAAAAMSVCAGQLAETISKTLQEK